MHLEDRDTAFNVRESDMDAAIETTRPHECGV
jgi:hypothetical protein